MKIVSAEFLTSAPASGLGIPDDGLAHVALVGRSNVGKSRLINALVRRKLARTSAAPGKTRLVNVYRVELSGAARSALYLVDLPGYGYARGGANAAAELKAVGEAYLQTLVARGFSRASPDADAELKLRATGAALLLVDARHPNLESDRMAAEWLAALGIDTHIVATKIDKLTRAARVRNLETIGKTFRRAALPVSAATGEGLDELWSTIARIARGADRDG